MQHFVENWNCTLYWKPFHGSIIWAGMLCFFLLYTFSPHMLTRTYTHAHTVGLSSLNLWLLFTDRNLVVKWGNQLFGTAQCHIWLYLLNFWFISSRQVFLLKKSWTWLFLCRIRIGHTFSTYCVDVFFSRLSRLWFSSNTGESEEVMEDDGKPLLGSIQAGDYYSDQTDFLDPRQRRYLFFMNFEAYTIIKHH